MLLRMVIPDPITEKKIKKMSQKRGDASADLRVTAGVHSKRSPLLVDARRVVVSHALLVLMTICARER